MRNLIRQILSGKVVSPFPQDISFSDISVQCSTCSRNSPRNSAASHLVTLRHVKKNITFDSIYLQLWLFISYFWTFNFFSVCEIWLIGFIVTLLKLLVQSHSKYYEVERLALLDRSSWGKYFESTNVHHV